MLSRERMRNPAGQCTKDENIFMVHWEPLGLGATFELDANYIVFFMSTQAIEELKYENLPI